MTTRDDRPRNEFSAPARHPPNPQIKAVLLVVFAGLVATALGVVFLLPSLVVQDSGTPVAAPTGTQAATPPPAAEISRAAATPDATEPNSDHKEAEKLLSEAFRRLARLESTGAQTWGAAKFETSLPAAKLALDTAYAHYNREQYTRALPLFQEALSQFDRLEANRPERFRLAMEQGQKAYDRLDSATAVTEFQIAVAIEQENEAARAALMRARKLPEVLAAIAKGDALEQAGNIEQALMSYQTATSLDSVYQPARDRLERIRKVIADRNYRRAVSEALVLLDKRDFKGSSAALDRAANIRPDTPEVKDISKRIEAGAQVAALADLRKRTKSLEAQEKWSSALELYKKALALDSTAAFANNGRIRAEALANLHKAMDRYLSEPARLQSPEPLAHAKALITQSASGNGEILARKRRRLQKLITAAVTPIPVILRSDGKTEVRVYRVGAFGSFDTRRIEMRPGTYTAVGSRTGYRDVRIQIQVIPGMKDTVVTIRCTEQIIR